MDVYPSLTYRDVAAALTWLENCFGLESRVFGAADTGRIDHAALAHWQGLVLGETNDGPGGMRGYSARDLEGNLWTFGTIRPTP